jgi:hypothetical protein
MIGAAVPYYGTGEWLIVFSIRPRLDRYFAVEKVAPVNNGLV